MELKMQQPVWFHSLTKEVGLNHVKLDNQLINIKYTILMISDIYIHDIRIFLQNLAEWQMQIGKHDEL